MRRKLFTVALAMSLAWCLAMAALWVRSDRDNDMFRLASQPRSICFYVSSSWGRLYLGRVTSPSQYWSGIAPRYPHVAAVHSRNGDILGISGGLLGFSIRHDMAESAYQSWAAAVPYWFLLSLGMLLPIRQLVDVYRRRHAAMIGHCPACRYDLTGNTSGICPECGTAVKG